jgi:hypothetical protein
MKGEVHAVYQENAARCQGGDAPVETLKLPTRCIGEDEIEAAECGKKLGPVAELESHPL